MRSSACALLAAAAVAACGASDESESTSDTVAATTLLLDDTEEVTILVETTEPIFLSAETDDPGAQCGGNTPSSSLVDESAVEIRSGESTVVEGTTGPGVLVEIVIREDLSVASIRCEFVASLAVDSIDVETFDLVFTSGPRVSVTAPGLTRDQLVDGLLISNG